MNKYTIIFLFFLTFFFNKKKNMKLTNVFQKTLHFKDYSIPKIIHKIIIVDGYDTPELPPEMEKAIQSFKLLNPDYEIKIYNGKDCLNYIRNFYSYQEEFIFENLIPYAYKCDFMKYLILYNEGGIYSDMKMICLKSFDKIFPKNLKWYSAIDSNPARMANGFIVSVKEHPILLNTIQKIKKNFWDKDIGIDSLFPTGPTTFEYGFETYFNNCMKYHNKNENYIKTEFDFLSIKKEVSLLNEEIVKENEKQKKKK